ncbi:LacI family DNA-binding transcriptional regulator [Paraglaciecola sp. L1A13]|uniref:LacI family DNA-binding transcriptional regulator n=1 Tax=Paraglaciecola sp. L1A13 TaxID=2686359 RepID=UPI00131B030D|nr:LacI family DNA-binding transcriptional regulator [Paraglaciecola sp. L1A13]
MATIYEVSALAGVSLATVSRVMNGGTRVSEKTRDKVNKAMDELNYRPSSIARSLASNCSNSVGILVSELHGPIYGAMMSGIEKQLRTAGKHVIIAAGHSDAVSEKDGIEFLIDRNCDALILHVEAISDEYLIELAKSKHPFILINRYIPQISDNCISLNNRRGGYLATKALLEHGHRDIAYISGPLWKMDASDRYLGHQDALSEYGITCNDKLLFESNFQEEGGNEGILALLDTHIPFSAVVCANDEMAAGAMQAARDKGVAVPDDISVMGFDNILLAQYMYPKLSTVNYPVKDMGKMAASWILKNIYQASQPEIAHVFEPELVWRDSVNSL